MNAPSLVPSLSCVKKNTLICLEQTKAQGALFSKRYIFLKVLLAQPSLYFILLSNVLKYLEKINRTFQRHISLFQGRIGIKSCWVLWIEEDHWTNQLRARRAPTNSAYTLTEKLL